SNWNLVPCDVQIRRHFPAAFAFVLKAEHQHGQAVESEAPDHTERVRFAQHVDIAVAGQDGEYLEQDHQVDDAMAGSISAMGMTEPVGQHAVLRNPVQYAVGANNRGIYRPRQDQESDHHDKSSKGQAQQMWTHQVHRQPRDEVVLVHRYAYRVRNNHHEQQGSDAGEDKAVNGNNDRRALQVLELRMGELAIYLGQRLFSTHGQDGVPECHQDA